MTGRISRHQWKIGLSQNANSYTMSQSALVMLSRADDVLKFIKNDFINMGSRNSTNYTYQMTLAFNWAHASCSNMSNAFTSIADITNCYEGFEIHINSDDPDFNAVSVRSNHSVYLTLYPPAQVYRCPAEFKNIFSNYITNSPTAPLSTSNFGNHGDWSDDLVAVWGNDNPTHYMGLSNAFKTAGGFLNTGNGTWVLKKNTAEIAWYDMGITLPYQNGVFNVIVPPFKCSVDITNNITGFQVKWYMYNPSTSSFSEIDQNSISSLIPKIYYYMRGVTNNYRNTGEYLTADSSGNLTFSNRYRWKTYVQLTNTEPDSGAYSFAGIGAQYDILGERIGFSFDGPYWWDLGTP